MTMWPVVPMSHIDSACSVGGQLDRLCSLQPHHLWCHRHIVLL